MSNSYVVIASDSETIQNFRVATVWIASAYAQGRFGGLRARHSSHSERRRVGAFAPRNDIAFRTHSAIPQRDAPEGFRKSVPQIKEGTGNAGCAARTHSLACEMQKARERSRHRWSRINRHSLRNGFNGFLRALPGDRALLPPSPRGYRRVGPVRADIA